MPRRGPYLSVSLSPLPVLSIDGTAGHRPLAPFRSFRASRRRYRLPPVPPPPSLLLRLLPSLSSCLTTCHRALAARALPCRAPGINNTAHHPTPTMSQLGTHVTRPAAPPSHPPVAVSSGAYGPLLQVGGRLQVPHRQASPTRGGRGRGPRGWRRLQWLLPFHTTTKESSEAGRVV